MGEWKIDSWWMKTLFVLASIQGVLTALGIMAGFIMGFAGVY